MSTIILHTAGVVIMMLADAQKHFTLKIQRGLITYGMFRYIRYFDINFCLFDDLLANNLCIYSHPNYTGEMMLYGSYVLLVRHWFPVLVVAAIWSSVFAARIVAKEISMSRYKEWPAYKSQSFYVIPYVL
jgi:protein-S-isoprenylcysteine O-methyltransferase Ste14